ncbi:MAG: hypothetical protein HYS13_23940 [Planctomycetia bacterium]|nr:hypothetical protein [Planctomycetia bacterium]
MGLDRDRRHSYRCVNPPQREVAVLQTGKSDHVVRVVEESAGGMGIVAPKAAAVKQGQTVIVVSASGKHELEVMHVVAMPGEKRIGLQRVRELPLAQKHATRRERLWHFSPGNLAISATAVVVAAIGVYLGTNYFDGKPGASQEWDIAAFATKLAESHQPERSERDGAQHVTRLGGLTEKSVVTQLKLTGQQQKQVAVEIDELTRRLALLFSERGKRSESEWADQGLLILRASWEQIDGILTDEQRMKWRELFVEKAAAIVPRDAPADLQAAQR